MKRPSFQFYPADWKNNSKLRRCSEAARGAWVDVLCLLHDSDEYGVCRWPLDEIARAAGVPLKLLKELSAKDVLKGADKNAAPYIYTPRHAGKDGEPVVLVDAGAAPCWYCSRFVRDEWIRQRRGQGTQFTSENQPPKAAPKAPPKGGLGERQGDGPTSTSTSTKEKAMSGRPDLLDILDHLNSRTSRNYQPVDANLKLIAARLSEGATPEQCKAVIDAKVDKWGDDPKMADYLRPATLFNATKFAQYVGEVGEQIPVWER